MFTLLSEKRAERKEHSFLKRVEKKKQNFEKGRKGMKMFTNLLLPPSMIADFLL
jgi:hypothetical protein